MLTNVLSVGTGHSLATTNESNITKLTTKARSDAASAMVGSVITNFCEATRSTASGKRYTNSTKRKTPKTPLFSLRKICRYC